MSDNGTLKVDQLTDNAFYILLTLINPNHGYSVMKSIIEITEGKFSVGPASLYTLSKG